MSALLTLDGVTKIFGQHGRGRAPKQLQPSAADSGQPAVNNVSFSLGRSEVLGLIGRNGAGKSTVLTLIAGITEPTSGTIIRPSSVRSVIELGLGFHPDLSGWRNAETSLLLHGVPTRCIPEALNVVSEFADIGTAMDRPISTLSAGMAARIAFGVATFGEYDLLLVDEALAVGDHDFQQRCFAKIQSVASRGTSVVFVSHDMMLVRQFCDRAIRLDYGRIVDEGTPRDVVSRYLSSGAHTEALHRPGPVRLQDLQAPATVGTQERLHIEGELVVEADVDAVSVTTQLKLPTSSLNETWVSSRWLHHAPLTTGRYRLIGLTDPLAFGGVVVRASIGVGPVHGHETWTEASVDIDVGDVRAGLPTQLAATLLPIHITRTDDVLDAEATSADVAHDAHSNGGIDANTFSASAASKATHSTIARSAGRAPAPDRSSPSAAAVIIRCENVTKRFRSKTKPVAVDAVSFVVTKGESLGIIGPNGSGKSTLVRMLAGVTGHTSGAMDVTGTTVALLDHHPGFEPSLSGRENLAILAALHGLSRGQALQRTEEMIEFCGLGAHIDVPLWQYSSGMRARLGTAVALHVPAELYLLDEVLAVGDEGFKMSVVERLRTLRDGGATIVFVSHEMPMVSEICERAIRLDAGRVVEDGGVHAVVAAYVGVDQAGGSRHVRDTAAIGRFDVQPRSLPAGGSLSFAIEVTAPSPTTQARLELGYRIAADHRLPPPDDDARYAASFLLRTLLKPADFVGNSPITRVEGRIINHAMNGRFEVFVAFVDEIDNVVIAERWVEVVVGRGESLPYPEPLFGIDWRIESAVVSGTSAN